MDLTPERWAHIEHIFHRAAECGPGERNVLLDEACSGDLELRRAVEELLAGQALAGEHVHDVVCDALEGVGFPLVGQTLSHYRILSGLGGGGMGLVYRAEDVRLNRQVALKLVPEHAIKDPAALGRFEQEARSAAALEHPNICPIYEFGEDKGRSFIVMQLLEGHTLRELLSATPAGELPFASDRLLDLALQIADGLEAAHRKGIIHRDIKPANVFITTQGEAKILDFGIAKLVQETREIGVGPHSESPNYAEPSHPLALTRTGTTVGTTSYMSPEQIQGEKLDARTDLFSFGLVLHEMATGHRAFGGETLDEIRDAILHHSAPSVRQVNPKLPPQFDEIIVSCLQKDRSARYQTASEVRTALENLTHVFEGNRIPRWGRLATWLTLLLAVAAITFWLRNPQPPISSSSSSQLKLRELTFNSAEKGNAAGMISPDGSYLAYKDAMGVHLQRIDTGESRLVKGLKTDNVDWEVAAWFPDSTRFLLNSHPPGQDETTWSSEGSDVWIVSLLGGTPRKLRERAYSYSVSADGALISFGTNKGRWGEREIWLMDPDGGHARKLFETGEDSCIGGLFWSSNGQQVFYQMIDKSGVTVLSRDLRGGPATTVIPSSLTDNPGEFWMLPDHRFIYTSTSSWVANTGAGDCTLWQIWIDKSTGKTPGIPSCLANWPASHLSHLSATANGKRVAFLKLTDHNTLHLADLDAKGHPLASPKQFTLTESVNLPKDWTADSQALIILSNRNGQFGIYKQELNEDTAKLLVQEVPGLENARVSPDGKWVVYTRRPPPDPSSPQSPLTAEVLRVAVTGGSPETVAKVPAGSLLLRARSPSPLCMIAEPNEDRNQLAFYAFDPLKGRGPELARIPLDLGADPWALDLSPDGTRIAILPRPEGPIRILSLNRLPPQELHVKGWSNMRTLDWAADGRGLLISNGIQGGAVLLRVDLRGNAEVLWKNSGVNWTPGLESPDGRHLAFQSAPIEGNMWMMENF